MPETLGTAKINDRVTVRAFKRKDASPVTVQVVTAPAIEGGESTTRNVDYASALALGEAMPALREQIAKSLKS